MGEENNFLGSPASAPSGDFPSRTLRNTQQTNKQKVIFCYSLLLQDFSKYLMLISKKPESCWLAMSPAYKEALGAGLGAAGGAGTRGRCLSQVSDVSRGRGAEDGSAVSLRAGRDSSFKGHRGAGERDARCSSSSGARTRFLFAGRWSPRCPQRRRLPLSFRSCHNQKRPLPPPTGSAPARYAPKEVPTCPASPFPGRQGPRPTPPPQPRSRWPRPLPLPDSPQAVAGWGLGRQGAPPPPTVWAPSHWALTGLREEGPSWRGSWVHKRSLGAACPGACPRHTQRRGAAASPAAPLDLAAVTFLKKPHPSASLRRGSWQQDMCLGFLPPAPPPHFFHRQGDPHSVRLGPRNAVILRGTPAPRALQKRPLPTAP